MNEDFSAFTVARDFAAAWRPEAQLTPEDWTAAGAEGLSPPVAFLVGAAAAALGPSRAAVLLEAAATEMSAGDATLADALGLGLPALPEAPAQDCPLAALSRDRPVGFVRAVAAKMAGAVRIEYALAAHAVAQISVMRGGELVALASAADMWGRP